jgi:hypothetical protein
MATAPATDGKHWVAGGVASGGSGNGILLWRITRYEINPYCEALDFFFDVSY